MAVKERRHGVEVKIDLGIKTWVKALKHHRSSAANDKKGGVDETRSKRLTSPAHQA